MVPVIWAFFKAEVSAGTASAARIAIIAITTSNSISVNAEMIFLIFMVGFLRVVLRVFSEGFVLGFVVGVRVEVSTFARGFGGYLFWGCLLFRLRFVQGGPYFEVRGYRNLQRVSQ